MTGQPRSIGRVNAARAATADHMLGTNQRSSSCSSHPCVSIEASELSGRETRGACLAARFT